MIFDVARYMLALVTPFLAEGLANARCLLSNKPT